MRILITGASRGIGLEFAKQCIKQRWRAFATCRHPQTPGKLFEVARLSAGHVSVHLLDVTDNSQIQALAYELRHEPIDILINNAGRYGSDAHEFGEVDALDWQETFRVNSIAPLKMAEAFISNLERGSRKLIVNVSSKMGSMADNSSGGSYIYRSSKAALNAVTKSLAIDLTPKKIACIAVHPGWVKTDMGGPQALITPQQSVTQLLAIMQDVTLGDSGRFFDIDGSEIPW
jgi:NAD(P)-dependent dehydrogenase (short-subunit alcohol dehydrogenase family)